MLPIGLGISQWINRAMAEALKRMRLKPFAFPNRMSQPGGGGTMGLQEGSPHVPTQPLAPPVAEPELPQLSLQAPPVESQEQQQQEPDWRAYFNEYVKLLRRQPIPLPPSAASCSHANGLAADIACADRNVVRSRRVQAGVFAGADSAVPTGTGGAG
jgi:hypothetical protein